MTSVIALILVAACGPSEGKPTPRVRNPNTGDCEPVAAATHDWPACNGACTDLESAACLSSAMCHQTSMFERSDVSIDECWELGTAAPAAGPCETLDAVGCATRVDCISDFELGANFGFERCAAKPQP